MLQEKKMETNWRDIHSFLHGGKYA